MFVPKPISRAFTVGYLSVKPDVLTYKVCWLAVVARDVYDRSQFKCIHTVSCVDADFLLVKVLSLLVTVTRLHKIASSRPFDLFTPLSRK